MQVALPLCGHFLRLPRARSSLTLLYTNSPPFAAPPACWPKTSGMCTPHTPCLSVCLSVCRRLQPPPSCAATSPPSTTATIIACTPRCPPPPSPSSPSQIDPRPTLRPGPRLGLAQQVERDDKHYSHCHQPTTTRRDRISDRNTIARHSLA